MASKACCSVPPILAVKDYKIKGDYTTIDGKKTCELLRYNFSHTLDG